LNPTNLKQQRERTPMKKPARLIFRKLATISFVIFAVSAVSPAAHARPKGIVIGSSHGAIAIIVSFMIITNTLSPIGGTPTMDTATTMPTMTPDQLMMGATGKIWPRKYSWSLPGAGTITGRLTE
jgi:hypothetical protein